MENLLQISYNENLPLFVALLLGILSITISAISIIITAVSYKKSRSVAIVTQRRKDRMENLRIFSSKYFSLLDLNTINDYLTMHEKSYFEAIVETKLQLVLLLDYRFEIDREIIKQVNNLANQSSLIYTINKKGGRMTDNTIQEYAILLKELHKSISAFLMTEWVRIKEEAGEQIMELTEWTETFEKHIKIYEDNC